MNEYARTVASPYAVQFLLGEKERGRGNGTATHHKSFWPFFCFVLLLLLFLFLLSLCLSSVSVIGFCFCSSPCFLATFALLSILQHGKISNSWVNVFLCASMDLREYLASRSRDY